MSQIHAPSLVVGISASAGGIAALQAFFARVPADSGCAYVVILHRSPDGDSHLAATLQSATPIPVITVAERASIAPNCVYVVPASRRPAIAEDALTASPDALPGERHAPADSFLRTLADCYGARAVCVILSGAGADGSLGLHWIKERGGAAFAQLPAEAACAELPRAAIATGLIDEVLPAAAIPARIAAHASEASRPGEPAGQPEAEPAQLRQQLRAAEQYRLQAEELRAANEELAVKAEEQVRAAMAAERAARLAAEAECARLYAEVLESRERVQHLSHRLIEAQEEERRHMARELHDEVGQELTGLRLALEQIGRLPPAERDARLAVAHQATQELIARIRALSLDLRPAMLDDGGLLPALLWQLRRFHDRTGIAVDLRHQGLEQRLPPAVETVAYRVVQEALTNIARHAGIGRASIRLLAAPAQLLVQVRDSGRGFVLAAAMRAGRSGGLTGMQERVALLGGTMSIETALGEGTVLTVDLPLDEAARLPPG